MILCVQVLCVIVDQKIEIRHKLSVTAASNQKFEIIFSSRHSVPAAEISFGIGTISQRLPWCFEGGRCLPDRGKSHTINSIDRIICAANMWKNHAN